MVRTRKCGVVIRLVTPGVPKVPANDRSSGWLGVSSKKGGVGVVVSGRQLDSSLLKGDVVEVQGQGCKSSDSPDDDDWNFESQ